MLRGPLGCKTFNFAKNIIFEGGDSHAIFYSDFISYYFDVDPDIHINNSYNNNCMEFDTPFIF